MGDENAREERRRVKSEEEMESQGVRGWREGGGEGGKSLEAS